MAEVLISGLVFVVFLVLMVVLAFFLVKSKEKKILEISKNDEFFIPVNSSMSFTKMIDYHLEDEESVMYEL